MYETDDFKNTFSYSKQLLKLKKRKNRQKIKREIKEEFDEYLQQGENFEK